MADDFKITIAPGKRVEPQPVPKESESFFELLKGDPKIWATLLTIALVAGFYFASRPDIQSTEVAMLDSDLDTVSSHIMGYVKSVSANEGDHVNAGQILAQLDRTDFEVEEKVKKAKFLKAEHDRGRAEMMADGQGISKSDLELAQLNYSANAADLEGTELKLKYTDIKSPISGRIARRAIQDGQYIQPGQTFFVIVPDGRIWVNAKFSESVILKIAPGQKARVYVDAMKKWFDGKVRAIDPATQSKLSIIPTENSTGNISRVVQRFGVLIDLDQAPAELRPGMSARVDIYVN